MIYKITRWKHKNLEQKVLSLNYFMHAWLLACWLVGWLTGCMKYYAHTHTHTHIVVYVVKAFQCASVSVYFLIFRYFVARKSKKIKNEMIKIILFMQSGSKIEKRKSLMAFFTLDYTFGSAQCVFLPLSLPLSLSLYS